MEEQKEKRLVEFFSSCGIVCDSINNNICVLNAARSYYWIRVIINIHEYIPDLKGFFSSSSCYLVAISADKSRWPLINIVDLKR